MEGEATLSVAGVIRQTSDILRRRAATLAALAALLLGLPQAVAWMLAASLPAHPGAQAALAVGDPLAEAVLSAVFRAAATYAALSALDGRTRSFAACLDRGSKLSLGTLVLGIRSGLGIAVGLILLVVPGIALFCAWAVIVPAYVEEGISGSSAFARSRELTYGHRWRILGLTLLYALASAVLLVPAFLLGSPSPASGLVSVPATVQGVATDALSVLADVAFAALYVELRRLSEGAVAGDLVAAFE